MNTAENKIPQLHLAARTLIEWRTPKDSADYKRVLRNLINEHPRSRNLTGLEKNDLILELDKSNAILWHLSESIEYHNDVLRLFDDGTEPTDGDAAKQTPPGLSAAVAGREVLNDLRHSVTSQEARTPIWPGGPNRLVLGDAILQSLMAQDNPKRVVLGLQAYFAAKTSQFTVKSKNATTLMLETTTQTSIQSLARVVSKSQIIATIVVTIVAILTNVLGLSFHFGPNRVRDILPEAVFNFLFGEVAVPTFLIAAVGFGTGLLSASIFIINKDLQYRFILEVYILLGKIFRANIGEILTGRFDEQLIGANIADKLGLACGTTQGTLVNVLKTDPVWWLFALSRTHCAEPRIIEEVIDALQTADLEIRKRQLIVEWLSVVAFC